MSNDDRDRLYEIIDDVSIAMLTTLEKDGSLHTRPMANQKADKHGAIWFFTEKNGTVAKNVENNAKLSLGYAGSGAYAVVAGKGRMVEDKAMIERLWSEAVLAWFPEGKDDPNLALLRVDPDLGEYWSFPSAPVSRVVGYVKAKLTGEKADDMGVNKSMSL
ncbi:pyridoxamine 5'-phosphate oxidase family protein [Mesorhizobium sp. NBSH29]|uniref:pyridoxamine 5'-phosphate oxidase family protein n=1 Tax=Mesorhizobium sp. NBSH29 TaxID=2654249 RepID=UPI0018968E16|nr:pyridoxamine 5'-phosphate oxidase family protein [Mesorhizobium sp. NBSH29]